MSYQQPSLISPPLSQTELEHHLWEAANILRGPVDAADFKTYIFPLLFYKRICDVYDEEYQQALAESDGDLEYASFDEHHRFRIPAGHHWRDVCARTKNLGHYNWSQKLDHM
jgi:type I restriction enzyme M protein